MNREFTHRRAWSVTPKQAARAPGYGFHDGDDPWPCELPETKGDARLGAAVILVGFLICTACVFAGIYIGRVL